MTNNQYYNVLGWLILIAALAVDAPVLTVALSLGAVGSFLLAFLPLLKKSNSSNPP